MSDSVSSLANFIDPEGRFRPSIDELDELKQALHQLILADSHRHDPLLEQEHYMLPIFGRVCDALVPVRALPTTPGRVTTVGWWDKTSRALWWTIDLIDELAKRWGWQGLTIGEPQRSLRLKQLKEEFEQSHVQPILEAALAYRREFVGLHFPYDHFADLAEERDLIPTITATEAEAVLPELIQQLDRVGLFGGSYPSLPKELYDRASDVFQRLHGSIERLKARRIDQDSPCVVPEPSGGNSPSSDLDRQASIKLPSDRNWFCDVPFTYYQAIDRSTIRFELDEITQMLEEKAWRGMSHELYVRTKDGIWLQGTGDKIYGPKDKVLIATPNSPVPKNGFNYRWKEVDVSEVIEFCRKQSLVIPDLALEDSVRIAHRNSTVEVERKNPAPESDSKTAQSTLEDSIEGVDRLPGFVRKAYGQYLKVVQAVGDPSITYPNAYEFYSRELREEDEKLVKKETWVDYVERGARLLGRGKNSTRSGRESLAGKSVIRKRDL